ncbi:MAG: hypothetical protein AMXMBFR72_20340 [Betaproteobacteria bacterium]
MRTPIAATLGASRRRLRAAADRLGTPGLVGAAVLAACVGYYAGSVRPLVEQIESLDAAAAQPQRPRTPAADPAEPVRRFAAAFPDEREVAPLLARLYAIGEREGVRLAQAEYRFVEPDALGMVQYRLSLPVNGSYPSIRRFVGAVLGEVPWAAVTQIGLQRERVGQGRIDARIEVTLHLRAGRARHAQDGSAPQRVSAVEGAP